MLVCHPYFAAPPLGDRFFAGRSLLAGEERLAARAASEQASVSICGRSLDAIAFLAAPHAGVYGPANL
jgi:hypothetical protein